MSHSTMVAATEASKVSRHERADAGACGRTCGGAELHEHPADSSCTCADPAAPRTATGGKHATREAVDMAGSGDGIEIVNWSWFHAI